MRKKSTFMAIVLAIFCIILSYQSYAGYNIYFLVGSPDVPGDLAVVQHLESNGNSITVVTPDIATAEEAAGFDIMLISSTISSGDATPYAELEIPLITWESFALHAGKLSMTNMNENGNIYYENFPYKTDGEGLVNSYEYLNVNQDQGVVNQGLTAGKPAEIQALMNEIEGHAGHCGTLSNPNANAIKILSYEKDDIVALAENNTTWGTTMANYLDSALCAAFVFPEGVEMATDFISPAARGFIFLHDNTATALTSDAWQIFDAMITWMVEGPIQTSAQNIIDQTKVFPTIVKNEVMIYTDSNLSGAFVNFFSTSGTIVKSVHLTGSENHTIDLSDLISGIYIVNLRSGNSTVNYRIVKE
ncbi:MAG: T9SS type A sorting domain-containing protein [Bacteroidales bacterium]|nr:T9SS type A sorting domain-containing protein [Bacteroidales bacterium]